MLGCVAVVRINVSEERIASIIRVTRIGELSISSQRASFAGNVVPVNSYHPDDGSETLLQYVGA
jgi:hypothetical protein